MIPQIHINDSSFIKRSWCWLSWKSLEIFISFLQQILYLDRLSTFIRDWKRYFNIIWRNLGAIPDNLIFFENVLWSSCTIRSVYTVHGLNLTISPLAHFSNGLSLLLIPWYYGGITFLRKQYVHSSYLIPRSVPATFWNLHHLIDLLYWSLELLCTLTHSILFPPWSRECLSDFFLHFEFFKSLSDIKPWIEIGLCLNFLKATWKLKIKFALPLGMLQSLWSHQSILLPFL